jgi:hypothetical protein
MAEEGIFLNRAFSEFDILKKDRILTDVLKADLGPCCKKYLGGEYEYSGL